MIVKIKFSGFFHTFLVLIREKLKGDIFYSTNIFNRQFISSSVHQLFLPPVKQVFTDHHEHERKCTAEDHPEESTEKFTETKDL